MLTTIGDDFVFSQETGITTAPASPITEILAHNRGVCQDFSHLMIGLARALNIPARYVSELCSFRSTKIPRLRSNTRLGGTVSSLQPGWVALDPTNKCIAGENIVKVAVGRNFQDVPPNKGVYKGEEGGEKIST